MNSMYCCLPSVHLISLDLHFYSRDAKPSPVGKFKIDFTLNALGPGTCCCCLPAHCNCCLECNDPVLQVFHMRLGELSKNYLEEELALLR